LTRTATTTKPSKLLLSSAYLHGLLNKFIICSFNNNGFHYNNKLFKEKI